MSEKPDSESKDLIESNDDVEEKVQPKTNKVRKITNYLLLVASLMLVFSIISDRIIPFTDNARVKGYVVPIKPEVSGQVLDILVQPNQPVLEGDVLVKLDPTDYVIAVKQAEQDLEIAGQNVGAQTAAIAASQARVTTANVELENSKLQTNPTAKNTETPGVEIAIKGSMSTAMIRIVANKFHFGSVNKK